MREVARSTEETWQSFSRQPQPVLQLSARTIAEDLVFSLSFAESLDSKPLTSLSELTFRAFMEQFTQLLTGLPQRSLWGEPAGGTRARRHESEAARRLDQLRLELRRFANGRLSFDRQRIRFEGDRMEIE